MPNGLLNGSGSVANRHWNRPEKRSVGLISTVRLKDATTVVAETASITVSFTAPLPVAACTLTIVGLVVTWTVGVSKNTVVALERSIAG